MKKFIKNIKPIYVILLTSFLAVFYYGYNINSWKYSLVGDEWPFFDFAVEIVKKNFLIDPFSLQGVYNDNPVLSSYYQALFLKIFGISHISWRFSNVVIIIPISLFFFLWLKRLLNSKIALISTLLLQTSFYLCNFFKIGKNMPISLLLFIISLYLADRCLDKRSFFNFVLLGIVLGLSSFVYVGPIFPFILLPYFILILFKEKFNITIIFKSLLPLLVYLLTILYIFLSPIYLNNVLTKTVLKKEFSNNWQVVTNVFHNFLLFYKNYDYLFNHYVVGGYLDEITAVFATIGIIICVLNIKKHNYLSLLSTYVATIFIIGITSPYEYTPTTRGIFLLPFGFAFAGIAMERIKRKVKWLPTTGLIIIILFINIYKSQYWVFKKIGYNITSLILNQLIIENNQKHHNPVILAISNNSTFNYLSVFYLKRIYEVNKVVFFVTKENEINCSIIPTNAKILYYEDNIGRILNNLGCDKKGLKIIKLNYTYLL